MQVHSYHIVNPSPWPMYASLGALVTTVGAVIFFHGYTLPIMGTSLTLVLGLIMIILTMYVWWRDVVREATFQGHHTKNVAEGTKIGMILFVVSEIFLFFSLFWAYFHNGLSPSPELGSVWPPVGIQGINPWHVPMLNTILLLASGASITWSHHAMISGLRRESLLGIIITILLAIAFTLFQVYEYIECPFTIADSVYGSSFFMITGFHGFHVVIGTLFIIICLLRLIVHHFTKFHHNGFEYSILYWHFVDYVWLFVFMFLYVWAFTSTP